MHFSVSVVCMTRGALITCEGVTKDASFTPRDPAARGSAFAPGVAAALMFPEEVCCMIPATADALRVSSEVRTTIEVKSER